MEYYKEELPCGEELVIDKCGNTWSWSLKFIFNGPDLRYNGKVIFIGSDEAEKKESILRKNYIEYSRLKNKISLSGKSCFNADGGMYIYIGGSDDGVTFVDRHYHYYKNYIFPINTQEKLDKIINDIEYAKKKFEIVVKELNHEDLKHEEHKQEFVPVAKYESLYGDYQKELKFNKDLIDKLNHESLKLNIFIIIIILLFLLFLIFV